jgi:soluble lytic murein transglycosylase
LYFDMSRVADGGYKDPAHIEAPLCTRDANSWQPPPSERGDIARALFYMAMRYDGSPWLASAAYNAGVDPVGRWLSARDALEPDFFIETIPYKETREYVSRVLAFSVIYDWRLHGNAVSLSSKLPKVGQAYTPPGEDAARKAVVCAPAASQAPKTATAVPSPEPKSAAQSSHE